jgi:uncharacterized protein DUF6983
MLIVPVRAVPNQTLSILLANQLCQLTLKTRFYGLFMDVSVNDAPIVQGVICQNWNRIVRSAYRGFVGDFAFWDTQGSADPVYTDLGSRYLLYYLEKSNLPGP